MTTTVMRLEDLEMPYFDFAAPAVAADPYGEARRLAQEHWIARTPMGYALLRWDEVKATNRDARFRSPEGLGLGAQGITEGVAYEWANGVLLGLDGETHARVRRLAQPGFTRENLERLRPYARELLDQILSEVVPAGRGEAAELARSYSVRVICRLLNWPDQDWEKISDWSDAATQVISVRLSPAELAEVEQALVELRRYTTAQLELLRGRQGDDLGSAILAAGEDGDRLSSTELVQLFETLLVAGTDTTKSELTNALLLFAQHPDQWELLADDPSLAPSAVEEVLRYHPVLLGTGRVAREDVVLHDVLVPAGTAFLVTLASANFDPAVYDEPERFDIRRFAGGSRIPKPNHMSFGFGAHVCLGNYLARLELQEALALLPERLTNLRVDADDPRGVEWSWPFGIFGPSWLPLRWDPLSRPSTVS